MREEQEQRHVKTGEKNLRASHFTCDHCNSLIWVEEDEKFPECERCGETTFQSQARH